MVSVSRGKQGIVELLLMSMKQRQRIPPAGGRLLLCALPQASSLRDGAAHIHSGSSPLLALSGMPYTTNSVKSESPWLFQTQSSGQLRLIITLSDSPKVLWRHHLSDVWVPGLLVTELDLAT